MLWDCKQGEKLTFKMIIQAFIVTFRIVEDIKGENFDGGGKLVFREKVIAYGLVDPTLYKKS